MLLLSKGYGVPYPPWLLNCCENSKNVLWKCCDSSNKQEGSITLGSQTPDVANLSVYLHASLCQVRSVRPTWLVFWRTGLGAAMGNLNISKQATLHAINFHSGPAPTALDDSIEGGSLSPGTTLLRHGPH